ncbi:MAG: hypothetical protein HY399_06055 [Elusimicrobia bacterium]|nr:hypothetical protein [Elusimicrobiota bacterium]
MKHASPKTLKQLQPLLKRIRAFSELKERKKGVFYFKSKAFLHFHEDPAGIFGDIHAGAAWKRFEINSAARRVFFWKKLKELVG